MEINLVTILLVIVALFVGYFISNHIKSKQPNSENFESALKNYFDVFEGKLRDLNTNFSNYIGKVEKGVQDVSKEVVENKVSLNLKQDQMIKNQNQIYEAFSGSKKIGISGEMMLENLLINSGLVETKQWIKNQPFRKDGHTLQVEYGMFHPSGLVLPIDSFWPKDAFNELIELDKKDDIDPDNKKLKERKIKEIVKAYENKAKDVKNKYIDHPLSTNFAMIYCPSPSLHRLLEDYTYENKEMFIVELGIKYNVTIVSPKDFNLFINGMLMAFNTLGGEKKAQKFSQYVEGFERLIATHNDNIEKLNNQVARLSTTSEFFTKSGTKIQEEMKRVKEIINEVTDSKK